MTREHFVEIELPDAGAAQRAAVAGRRRAGCIRPTARSTSRSAQGAARAAAGADAARRRSPGALRRSRSRGSAFQSGKDKTVLIDLAGVFPRRRAAPAPAQHESRDLLGSSRMGGRTARCEGRRRAACDLERADLRYRGFSATIRRMRARRNGRAIAVDGVAPRWRDLEGYPHPVWRRARAAGAASTIATSS